MLIERDVQKILNQLAQGNPIRVPIDGSDIMIHFSENGSRLHLSALVFDGENYIPPSVRNCIKHKISFHPALATSLSVDEKKFQIKINHVGRKDNLSHREFKELLEEFGTIAEKWRDLLDEHGRNDLIYVHAK